MDFFDISCNMNEFDISYNVSYSSPKLLKVVNELTNIKGKYAEFKITNNNIAKEKKSLFSLIYFKEGLITNFTFDQYKYRNIDENTQMYYEESNGSGVSYDSTKLFINLDSYFLEIHIWNETFDYPEYDFDISINKINNIPRTIYIDFIDYEWINSIIYKKKSIIDKKIIFDKVKCQLTNYKNYSIDQMNDTIGRGYLIIFNKTPLLQIKKNYELQKYNVNDIIQLITKDINVFEDKIIPNYLQHDLCRWMNDEMKNETSIEKTIFFRFMPFFLETLGNDFKKLYSFNSIPLNFTGLEISKCKKSVFTAIISLTKGKINNTHLNMGDLMISSKELQIDEEYDNNFFLIHIDFIF